MVDVPRLFLSVFSEIKLLAIRFCGDHSMVDVDLF